MNDLEREQIDFLLKHKDDHLKHGEHFVYAMGRDGKQVCLGINGHRSPKFLAAEADYHTRVKMIAGLKPKGLLQ